jgi:hypothetical protein
MRNAEQHCGRHAQRSAVPGRARRVQANASAEQITAMTDGKYRFCDGRTYSADRIQDIEGNVEHLSFLLVTQKLFFYK